MGKEFLLALDAGHGLHTAGKRCMKAIDPNETGEWRLNDRVSRYIAERAAGYQGFGVLRVDDVSGQTDVSRSERCRRANEAKADLYLSNHHNAGINGGSGGGVVAFCMRGGAKARQWRDALYGAVVAAGGLRGNRSEPCGERNYDVLVQSDMPAVLIEYGFMDSSADVPVILSEEYAKTVGYAVADCIAQGVGLRKKAAFRDVPEDAWYAGAVAWCAERGLMQGTSQDRFEPERAVTRAELAAVLARMQKSG